MNGQGQAQVVLPSPRSLFTPGVTAVLLLLAAGLTLNRLAAGWVMDWLALSPSKVLQGYIWQVLTYWVIADSLPTLVLDGFIIVMFGSAIERQWRAGPFVALWMVTCGVTGLIWVLVNQIGHLSYVGMGPSAGCFGLIGAFGLLFRGQRFFLLFAFVEARVLAWILVGLGAAASLAMPITLIWVVGAPVSVVTIRVRKVASRMAGLRSGQAPYRPNRFVDVD